MIGSVVAVMFDVSLDRMGAPSENLQSDVGWKDDILLSSCKRSLFLSNRRIGAGTYLYVSTSFVRLGYDRVRCLDRDVRL